MFCCCVFDVFAVVGCRLLVVDCWALQVCASLHMCVCVCVCTSYLHDRWSMSKCSICPYYGC